MSGGEFVGVSDHGGWAVLVTATRDGALVDRRRVELVDDSLPALPHHHDAALLAPDEGVALVERVRASAELHAMRVLDELAHALPRTLAASRCACVRRFRRRSPNASPTIAREMLPIG